MNIFTPEYMLWFVPNRVEYISNTWELPASFIPRDIQGRKLVVEADFVRWLI